MGKPLDTRVIEYAYEISSKIVANLPVTTQETVIVDNGDTILVDKTQYKILVEIEYDLQDAKHNSLDIRIVEHFSELRDKQFAAEEITQWLAENRDTLIANDKNDLSGYGA